jgi:phage baseplate assembly protein W|tara:strand:- start:73 stop:510 length:438 start_codon:yes stop_codon:yes gene_type:complete
MAIKIGVKLPLDYNSNGYAPTLTIAEEALADITNLVLTNPGELAWNDRFGVGLERYLFEHDTETLRADLSSVIAQQMAEYIGYVEFLGVEFQDVTSGGILKVMINYAIKDAGTLQNSSGITFSFDPASGLIGRPEGAPEQVPIGF